MVVFHILLLNIQYYQLIFQVIQFIMCTIAQLIMVFDIKLLFWQVEHQLIAISNINIHDLLNQDFNNF
jgi:hypothetical protein